MRKGQKEYKIDRRWTDTPEKTTRLSQAQIDNFHREDIFAKDNP